MYTLQNLEVTHLWHNRKGIFVFAKYHGWHSEYKFFVQPDGKIKGRTSSGFWEEISSAASEFLKAKIRNFLIDRKRELDT